MEQNKYYELKPISDPPKEDLFECEECKRNLPLSKLVKNFADIKICDDCLSNYPNETGCCSVECRLSGRCDQSC